MGHGGEATAPTDEASEETGQHETYAEWVESVRRRLDSRDSDVVHYVLYEILWYVDKDIEKKVIRILATTTRDDTRFLAGFVVANTRMLDAVPLLINWLEEPELHDRAWENLVMLTGQGFRSKDPREEQRLFRAWWAKNENGLRRKWRRLR